MSRSLVPAGARAYAVDLPGGRVRVLRSTATPSDAGASPLMLLHGGGTDNAGISWFHAFEAFGSRRHVVAIDLPGFGETTVPPVGGADAMADVVAEVMVSASIPAAVAVGVSMGGEVALQLALRRPDLVTGLVLVAPGGLVPVFRNRAAQLAAWAAAQLPDPVLLALAGVANRHVEIALRAMVSEIDALPPLVVSEFAREARRPGAGMGYGRYNQASIGPFSMRNDLTPAVHRIRVPTVFFHGARDPLVPLAGSRRASDLVPGSDLVVAAGAGHWAQLEAPDLFACSVLRFLGAPDDGVGGTG